MSVLVSSLISATTAVAVMPFFALALVRLSEDLLLMMEVRTMPDNTKASVVTMYTNDLSFFVFILCYLYSFMDTMNVSTKWKL